jgi:hypothetical protein
MIMPEGSGMSVEALSEGEGRVGGGGEVEGRGMEGGGRGGGGEVLEFA